MINHIRVSYEITIKQPNYFISRFLQRIILWLIQYYLGTFVPVHRAFWLVNWINGMPRWPIFPLVWRHHEAAQQYPLWPEALEREELEKSENKSKVTTCLNRLITSENSTCHQFCIWTLFNCHCAPPHMIFLSHLFPIHTLFWILTTSVFFHCPYSFTDQP